MSDKFLTKLMRYFDKEKPRDIIIYCLDLLNLWKNNLRLPSTNEFTWVKINIKNESIPFQCSMTEESTNVKVFCFLELKNETFSVGFYIDECNLETLNKISFATLYKVALNIKDSMWVSIVYPHKENEIINIRDFIFTNRIEIYTPYLSLLAKESSDFRKKFEKWGAKLRITTEEDLDFKDRFSPKTIDDLRGFIWTFEKVLLDNPNDIEAVFQKMIESNMQILDLYGKRYIPHPTGFELPEWKTNIHWYGYLIPDFLIEHYDETVELIEIERPEKKAMIKSWQQSHWLTQALAQIDQRENAVNRNPKLLASLMKEYPEICSKRKYTLVYGRDSGFDNDEQKKEFFTEILATKSKNIQILTFDDLIKKAKQAIQNISKPEEQIDLKTLK